MIEVNSICKYYGDFPAVTDVSFTIENYGVYGFLGPNGAGKSTTMNILTGCLSADSGTVRIDGNDILEKPELARAKVGYLPETPPIYMDMTPVEYLRFVAGAKGVDKRQIKEQTDSAIELTGLKEYKNKLIGYLSKGYKQRVGIAQALVGDPYLIILDEPTVGLDPKQISDIRDLITSLGKDHVVLFSSHILSDVQAVCSHVMIIAGGRLIADNSIGEIEKMLKNKPVLKISFHGGKVEADSVIETLNASLDIRALYADIDTDIVRYEIGLENTEGICEKLFFAAASKGIPIVEMYFDVPTLEDAFIELTKGHERHLSR